MTRNETRAPLPCTPSHPWTACGAGSTPGRPPRPPLPPLPSPLTPGLHVWQEVLLKGPLVHLLEAGDVRVVLRQLSYHQLLAVLGVEVLGRAVVEQNLNGAKGEGGKLNQLALIIASSWL